MSEFEPFIPHYSHDKPQYKAGKRQGDGMLPQPLQLDEGDQEVKVFFHDKSAFQANGYARELWLRHVEVALKKKEKGQLMMVSDFICQSTHCLSLSDEIWEQELHEPVAEHLPQEARVVSLLLERREGITTGIWIR